MAFTEKSLRFTFSGAKSGSFTAAGLRAAVNIQSSQDRLGSTAQARIWGLSLAQMTKYSSKWASVPGGIQLQQFKIIIEAGDLGGQLREVLNGPIFSSSINLSDSPESAFDISSIDTYTASMPIAPQSQAPRVPGQPSQQPAEQLIANVCAAAGLTFDNSANAHQILVNMSTYGSAIDQIARIAGAAGFNWKKTGNTISIWQRTAIDDVVINLGPNTSPAMVGYPSFSDVSLYVTSVFNPQIQVGRRINVISSIPNAQGLWQIVQVEHELTTMIAKGPWFTSARLIGAGA